MQSEISAGTVTASQNSSDLLNCGFPDTHYQRGTCAADITLSADCPIIFTLGANDTELPLVMANLKISDALKETSKSLNVKDQIFSGRILMSQAKSTFVGTQNSSPRRILRSQVKSAAFGTQNRHCNLKPAKMDGSDIKAYYLNKKFQKPLAKSLETIYEEPVIKRNGEFCMMGPKKARRIKFDGVTKAKDKKRKVNLKKKIRNSVSKRASYTREEFIAHLCSLMLEDICKIETR